MHPEAQPEIAPDEEAMVVNMGISGNLLPLPDHSDEDSNSDPDPDHDHDNDSDPERYADAD